MIGTSKNRRIGAEEEVALVEASLHGHAEVVELLLDEGANVNATDKKGETALVAAVVMNRDTDITGILLEAGSNPNQAMEKGVTALLAASYLGKRSMV